MTEQQFTTEELNSEEWKVIPGFEAFEASTLGRIRRAKATKLRPKNSIMNQRHNGTGYLLACVPLNEKTNSQPVHRLIALAFLPPPNANQSQVNHKDGVKMNSKPENLEWVTPLENTRHSIHSLKNDHSGENHGEAKLTAAQVLEIHNLRMDGKSPNEIAKLFSLNGETVRRIIQRRGYVNETAGLPVNYPPLSKSGRCRNPTGLSVLTDAQKEQLREALTRGDGVTKIAREMQIPLGTVGSFKYRIFLGKRSKRS